MPSAMTPSQARTPSASSIVRSMRDGGATAPDAPRVTTASWIVDMRASASVEEMPCRSARSSPRRMPRRAAEHCLGLGVERLGVEPRTDPRDLTQHACLAMRQLVEILLEIVDRDLLRDDAPEPGEAGNRVLYPVDRYADGE